MYQLLIVLSIWVGGLSFAVDTIPLLQNQNPPAKALPSDDSLADTAAQTSALDSPMARSAEPLKPFVASVDTYGSNRIDGNSLRKDLGAELDAWLRMGLAGDPNSVPLEKKLAKKIKDKYDFASAEWTVLQYFEPNNHAIYITLDVVEKKDLARREPFTKAPKGHFADPDGLIAAWQKYEDIALGLVESGELNPDSDKCPAFHCPFGHRVDKLKPFEKQFVDGVAKNTDKLVQILQEDERPEFREAACYLLAYAKDGRKLVSWLIGRVKDPAPGVRNNALRVLGDIAEYHSELVIPLKPIIEAMDFPRTTDRNKAVYVAYLSSMNSKEAQEMVLQSGFKSVINLMLTKQPDSHDIAWALAKKVSGKDFKADDKLNWEQWYSKTLKRLTSSQ